MRLLHTSDWHLGRMMAQEALLEDQAEILDQIFTILVESGADVIVIAGDVFDRAVPRKEAVDLFDRFLTRVYRETPAAIVALAGNHDAPERVGFGGALQDSARVLIRGPLSSRAAPLILKDDHGPVAISALPFCEVYAARAHYQAMEVSCPEHVLREQLQEARAVVSPGSRWVVCAHAFVQGGAVTDTERSLDFVGGVETVPHTLFEGAAYVALGHLHRSQAVGAEHIRYSGAPMAFGFDEAGAEKSVLLVDLGPHGVSAVEARPLVPLRSVRVIEGTLDALIRAAPQPPCRDFIKAVLHDEGELVDPMGRLRTAYPFALQIERRARQGAEAGARIRPAHARREPFEVVDAFLQDVRGGAGPSAEECEIVRAALADAVDEAI
ncbi:exonuclease SbcCD subunit D [Phenylobacterium sp.]|uniref:exonuclease SbcCD subunit D n=1 Tax=Phenylobacterium sp. TaxID=1871053 RepID=UPI0025FF6694|nr:exonuclease SbcCD subunit D [Phenylobacterium sp.]